MWRKPLTAALSDRDPPFSGLPVQVLGLEQLVPWDRQGVRQADLDQRSRCFNDEAFEYLHSGALGKIVVARAFCYKLRPSIGNTHGQGLVPKTVDYDLWCGPAQM